MWTKHHPASGEPAEGVVQRTPLGESITFILQQLNHHRAAMPTIRYVFLQSEELIVPGSSSTPRAHLYNAEQLVLELIAGSSACVIYGAALRDLFLPSTTALSTNPTSFQHPADPKRKPLPCPLTEQKRWTATGSTVLKAF